MAAALGFLALDAGSGRAAPLAPALPPTSASPPAATKDSPSDARANVDRAIVDRVAVRFYSPETGGTAHTRFVTERLLSFEARLDALGEAAVAGAQRERAFDERNVKNALDRHIVEELLSTLDASSAKSVAEEQVLAREARADLEERAGGAGPIGIAAEDEGLGADEVEAVFVRRARAAAYVDRAVTRFLHPDDEVLREVYRTSQHPFRQRSYEDARLFLTRWFVFERLKVLESSFLQTARARLTVVVIPR